MYKARSKKDNSVLALKKILMHHEKEGVCFTWNFPNCTPQLTCSVKFPITAIREIKILKVLSHPNVLQLKEMAVERSKGKRWSLMA